MKTILELLTKDIHKAFVSLWLQLASDYPGFQREEQSTLESKGHHAETKAKLIERLVENSPLRIRNYRATLRLAVLEGRRIPVSYLRHKGGRPTAID